MRYVEYGSDEEEEGNDNDNLYAASPPKKPKRKPKSTQANKTGKYSFVYICSTEI